MFWKILGFGTLSGLRGYGGLHLLLGVVPQAWGLMLTGLALSPCVGLAFGVCAAALTCAACPPARTPARRLLFQCLLVALGVLTYLHCGMLERSVTDPAWPTLVALLGPWPALQEGYGRGFHESPASGGLFFLLVYLPAVIGGLTALRLGLWVVRQATPPPPAPALRALTGLFLGIYAASSGALLLSGLHRAARLHLDEKLLVVAGHADAAAQGGKATEDAATLLRLGASPNAVDSLGYTAFGLALQQNDPGTVGLLLDHGARLDGGALIWSIAAAEPAMTRVLIAHGADPNSVGPTGETALISAARQGDPATIRTLLQAGAAVNARTNFGLTALTVLRQKGVPAQGAARQSYREALQLLQRSGATP